jgi:parafibromin
MDEEKIENTKNANNFIYKIKGHDLNFELHCSVRNFSKNDWKRVVAVFVQGNEWEFNDWPKNESITTIFLKVRGFHLKFTDLPLNDNIKKWNVKVLEMSRSKKHSVVSVQNLFWKTLEDFLGQPRYRNKTN